MIRALFLVITFTLVGCGSVKDVVTGKKKPAIDEFLVEKKNPLVMPPDYGKLPEPSFNQSNKEKEAEVNKSFGNIEDLLNNKENSLSEKNQTQSSSLEESILEKIN